MNARQVLRWSLHDHPTAPTTNDLLAVCLHDSDWELRATAMLGVGLTHATTLLNDVKRLTWPQLPHTPILTLWQRAIATGAPVSIPTPRNRETLFLFSLLTPLSPTQVPHRPGYRFIAPEPHWLGDDNPNLKFPNPIRCLTPPHGFWISERRISEATFAGALAAAREQSRLSGLAVRLPTADEWEMAARSTDGRLYPWGNAPEPGAPALPSPWGCHDLMCGHGEWTADNVLCGSSPRWGLPTRVLDSPPTRTAGFRFIVEFERPLA